MSPPLMFHNKWLLVASCSILILLSSFAKVASFTLLSSSHHRAKSKQSFGTTTPTASYFFGAVSDNNGKKNGASASVSWLHAALLTPADDDISSDDTTRSSYEQYLKQAEEAALQTFQETEAPQWMKETTGFPFECTACGKCCKTTGDVYLSPDEVEAAATILQLESYADFVYTYASHVFFQPPDNAAAAASSQSGTPKTITSDDLGRALVQQKKPWVRLKEKARSPDRKNKDETAPCIFLDVTTNYCQIYEARPVQCRTYPFWPSIMKSPVSWNEECRRMDHDEDSLLPAWTPDLGGCEGMQPILATNSDNFDNRVVPSNNNNKSTVPQISAYQQLYEYETVLRRFPETQPEIPIV